MAERDEAAAFRDDQNSDAVLSDDLMWNADELPREETTAQTPESEIAEQATKGEPDADTHEGQQLVRDRQVTQPEVISAADEQPIPPYEQSTEAARRLDATASSVATIDATSDPGALSNAADALNAAGESRWEMADLTAVATQPDFPRRLPDTEMTRMADLLQTAWHDQPDRVHSVLSDDAWPALANTMHRLDAKHHDVAKLLSRIDAPTMESAMPAVTTSWALRASSAGQHSRQRMMATRQAHRERLNAALDKQPAVLTLLVADLAELAAVRNSSVQHASTEPARLLAIAFPQDTKTALNRASRSGAPGSEPIGPGRDRGKAVQVER